MEQDEMDVWDAAKLIFGIAADGARRTERLGGDGRAWLRSQVANLLTIIEAVPPEVWLTSSATTEATPPPSPH